MTGRLEDFISELKTARAADAHAAEDRGDDAASDGKTDAPEHAIIVTE